MSRGSVDRNSWLDTDPSPYAMRPFISVCHAGTLIKLGQKVKNWRVRYFRLEENILTYYKREHTMQPRGALSLIGSRVEEGASSLENIPGTNDTMFSVTVPPRDNISRTYVFICDDHDSRNQWLKVITDAIEKYKNKKEGNDQINMKDFLKQSRRSNSEGHIDPLSRQTDKLVEGYLTKCTKKGKRWQRRFFVLSMDALTLKYYPRNPYGRAMGKIPLARAQVKIENDESYFAPKRPNCTFSVKAGDRILVMCASSASERQIWKQMIEVAIVKTTRRTRSVSVSYLEDDEDDTTDEISGIRSADLGKFEDPTLKPVDKSLNRIWDMVKAFLSCCTNQDNPYVRRLQEMGKHLLNTITLENAEKDEEKETFVPWTVDEMKEHFRKWMSEINKRCEQHFLEELESRQSSSLTSGSVMETDTLVALPLNRAGVRRGEEDTKTVEHIIDSFKKNVVNLQISCHEELLEFFTLTGENNNAKGSDDNNTTVRMEPIIDVQITRKCNKAKLPNGYELVTDKNNRALQIGHTKHPLYICFRRQNKKDPKPLISGIIAVYSDEDLPYGYKALLKTMPLSKDADLNAGLDVFQPTPLYLAVRHGDGPPIKDIRIVLLSEFGNTDYHLMLFTPSGRSANIGSFREKPGLTSSRTGLTSTPTNKFRETKEAERIAIGIKLDLSPLLNRLANYLLQAKIKVKNNPGKEAKTKAIREEAKTKTIVLLLVGLFSQDIGIMKNSLKSFPDIMTNLSKELINGFLNGTCLAAFIIHNTTESKLRKENIRSLLFEVLMIAIQYYFSMLTPETAIHLMQCCFMFSKMNKRKRISHSFITTLTNGIAQQLEENILARNSSYMRASGFQSVTAVSTTTTTTTTYINNSKSSTSSNISRTSLKNASGPYRTSGPSRTSGPISPSRSSGAISPSRSSGPISPSRSSGVISSSRTSGSSAISSITINTSLNHLTKVRSCTPTYSSRLNKTTLSPNISKITNLPLPVISSNPTSICRSIVTNIARHIAFEKTVSRKVVRFTIGKNVSMEEILHLVNTFQQFDNLSKTNEYLSVDSYEIRESNEKIAHMETSLNAIIILCCSLLPPNLDDEQNARRLSNAMKSTSPPRGHTRNISSMGSTVNLFVSKTPPSNYKVVQHSVLLLWHILASLSRSSDLIEHKTHLEVLSTIVCPTLLYSVMHTSGVFRASMKVLSVLWSGGFRDELLSEIGLVIDFFLTFLKRYHGPEWIEHDLAILDFLKKNIFVSRASIMDIFFNYDDAAIKYIAHQPLRLCTKICESIAEIVISIEAGMREAPKLQRRALDFLLHILEILKTSTGPSTPDRDVPWRVRLLRRNSRDESLRVALEMGQKDLKLGIRHLKNSFTKLKDTEFIELVSDFLFTNSHSLNSEKLGDYLGSEFTKEFNDKQCVQLRHSYTSHMNFSCVSFSESLRNYLIRGGFRLPGEAQKIDRMLVAFCVVYCEQNPNMFPDSKVTMVLAFAMVMLNTDLHGGHTVKKMTEQEFIANLRGLNDGNDFDKKLLIEFYRDIATAPILKQNQSPSSTTTTTTTTTTTIATAHIAAAAHRLSNGSESDEINNAEKRNDCRSELLERITWRQHLIRRNMKFKRRWIDRSALDADIDIGFFETVWPPICRALALSGEKTGTYFLKKCIQGFKDACEISKNFHLKSEFDKAKEKLAHLEEHLKTSSSKEVLYTLMDEIAPEKIKNKIIREGYLRWHTLSSSDKKNRHFKLDMNSVLNTYVMLREGELYYIYCKQDVPRREERRSRLGLTQGTLSNRNTTGNFLPLNASTTVSNYSDIPNSFQIEADHWVKKGDPTPKKVKKSRHIVVAKTLEESKIWQEDIQHCIESEILFSLAFDTGLVI